MTARAKKSSKFPRGWSEERVQAVIAHYDSQSEDDVAAEIEAAFRKPGYAVIAVPLDLVDNVRQLVARRLAKKHRPAPRRVHAKRAVSR